LTWAFNHEKIVFSKILKPTSLVKNLLLLVQKWLSKPTKPSKSSLRAYSPSKSEMKDAWEKKVHPTTQKRSHALNLSHLIVNPF